MTSEKLKIIQFAEEHGNQAAQREFGIAESNVRLWASPKKIFRKCRDFNVPIVEEKQLGLDSNYNFFLESVWKNRVRIIYGAHYTQVNTVVKKL